MCIEEVSSKKPVPSGYGYKVFRVDNNTLYSAFMDTPNPGNEWLIAEDSGHDEPGFHIYATREKADECVRWYDHFMCRSQKPENRTIYKV